MAGLAATYINTSQFSIVGNKVSEFIIGRRVRCNCGVDGNKYGTVEDSTSVTGITVVTLSTNSDNLTSNLTEVEYGIVSAYETGSIPEHNHTGEEGSGGELIENANTLYVSKEGSDITGNGDYHNPYLTIKYANDSITTESAFNRFVVKVQPGAYTEEPITMKSYVDIRSESGPFVTSIMASDSTSDLITHIGRAIINGFALSGPFGVQLDAALINLNAPGGACIVENIVVSNARIGVHITAGSNVIENINTVPIPFTSVGTLIRDRAVGVTLVRNPFVVGGSTVGTVFDASGANVLLQLQSALCSGTHTTGIRVTNGASVGFAIFVIINATNGIIVNNAQHVHGLAPNMDTSVTNHIVVQDLNSHLEINGGILNRERFVFQPGYDNYLISGFQDPVQEMTGFLGDASFGDPELGSVVRIGEGQSYTQDMNVITTDDTATDTTEGGNFIDVSDIAAANSDSTATFSFQGVGANHTILVGSEKESSTDKLKVLGFHIYQTLRAIEDSERSFILEYWNGTQWTEKKIMAVSEEYEHTYANAIFIRSNSDEIFHNRAYDDETKKTINGKNLYWLRFRITDTLIQAPTFLQWRLQTSKISVSQQGIIRFISTARFRKNIFSPNNYGRLGNVTSGSNAVGVGASPYGWTHNVRSSIINNVSDALHLQFSLPLGVCTSCPINIKVDYRVPTSGVSSNGTMIMSFLPSEAAGVVIADETGGIDPIPRPVATTSSVVSSAATISTHSLDLTTNDKIISIISDDFNIDSFYEGDYVFIQIQVTDMGNAGKTMIVYGVSVYGVNWRLGGRIDLGYVV